MVEIIIAIISGVLAGGITPFLFLGQEKRSKNIDNEAKQSGEWKKLYDEECEERKNRDEKIEALYDKINQHRDEKSQMAKRITELEVENVKLKLLMCKVPSCPKREPQTGY